MASVLIDINRNKLPANTDEQFEEWVQYNVGQLGGIKLNNPLSAHDMEATVMDIRA